MRTKGVLTIAIGRVFQEDGRDEDEVAGCGSSSFAKARQRDGRMM